jgi:uncharacterized phiE125 gp8 family phage protein
MSWDDWTRGSRSAPAHSATKLITPPSVEPFTLAEAKLHCRIDTDADNANVTKWIRAARSKVERDTGRALLTQIWDLFLDAFYTTPPTPYAAFNWPRYQAPVITVPYPPLQSVTSVNQTDSAGNETVWNATNYVVDTASEPGRIGLTDTGAWPTGLRVFQPGRIRYVAGYLNPAAIPGDLLEAQALLMGWMSEHREPDVLRRGSSENEAYDSLIAAYVMYTAA